jgi:hypothetical protein
MICVLCREVKPLDAFFVDGEGNVSKACKQCAFEGYVSKASSVVSSEERTRRFEESGECFCNICHQWQFKDRFYRNNNMKFGYSYTCKGCMRQMFRNVRAKNKEKNLVRESIKPDERKPVTEPPVINITEPEDIRSQILKRKPVRLR